MILKSREDVKLIVSAKGLNDLSSTFKFYVYYGDLNLCFKSSQRVCTLCIRKGPGKKTRGLNRTFHMYFKFTSMYDRTTWSLCPMYGS